MRSKQLSKQFFKTEKNMLHMDQGSGWILNSHMLDKSLYYKDHLHLIENGNTKFASKISDTIRNFNQLQLNFQLTLSCHSPSMVFTINLTSRVTTINLTFTTSTINLTSRASVTVDLTCFEIFINIKNNKIL